MNRTRRAVAVFLLALAVALPVAALPAPQRALPSWEGLFAAFWARLAPVLGLSEKSRPSGDPNGTPVTTPPAGTDSAAASGSETDSRSSMDPDG